jgi:transketolase
MIAQELHDKAQQIRMTVVDMIYRARSGHAGGSLSAVEILTVLYRQVMRIRPDNPTWPDRDRLVLSKGHAAPALYAVLADLGFFDACQLMKLRQLDSCLQGHPCMFKLPGIDMSTGSLGMGISVCVGMALAARQSGRDYTTYVLCGDGELNEGQNWETLMAAAKWQLDNLCIIVDRNHVQLDGIEADVMPLPDLKAAITAFGHRVITCDGHDCEALLNAFREARQTRGRSTVIVAETVKGKGVSFMEGKHEWHGKQINPEDYVQAQRELLEDRK